MRIKTFTRRSALRLTFPCGLFLSLVVAFLLDTHTIFPILYNDAVDMRMKHMPDDNVSMQTTKERLLEEERDSLQVQLELMKRQLNQTDTALRQERDSLKVQLERMRRNLNQSKTYLRQERDSLQAQLKRSGTPLQQERESRQEEQSSVGPRVEMYDMRPILVTIAHQPRYDLLGSFVGPTLHLLAIAVRNGWALEILPFAGSIGEKTVKELFGLGHNISEGWGSGFIDASNREGYDPAKLNAMSYNNLGFFPEMPDPAPRNRSKWIDIDVKSGIPKPGPELVEMCKNKVVPGNGVLRCRLWFPPNFSGQEAHFLQGYIEQNGGSEVFFNPSFRLAIRERYFAKNAHRLKRYGLPAGEEAQNNSTSAPPFNVAIHVRRGDILDPNRWIDQSVFVTVARRICKLHPGVANIHVFSSGKNRDGNWSVLEEVGSNDECRSVAFHLDEDEFDTWAHMVAADVLVMSKSAFSVVPAILSAGEIYFPHDYWGTSLSHWHRFREKDGADVKEEMATFSL